MCGIAGLFRTDRNVSEHDIVRMTDAIRHRGPDGSGVKMFDQRGGIGHRRLSIIDLSTGAQPMCNESGTVWITFNGEIYNYKELRSVLEGKGYSFRTASDTEVLIHGYSHWGEKLMHHLRGMFSFAVVDTAKEQVLLSRDHFGIKPLYVYHDGKTFAFASELQALYKVSDAHFEMDIASLDDYLWFQYIPAPATIWKNVHKLKPASFQIYKFDGSLSNQSVYWDIDFSSKRNLTTEEWLEEADAVIKESVQAHLVADVPFGAFLSGGVDSTLVVSYMAELMDKPVSTFSIGFEEAEYNELKFSDEAARRFGTKHTTEIVRPDALDVLSKLVAHYGEPYGDSSAIPTYYLCKLTRNDVTMALSGDGGDEAFAGYGSYVRWLKYQAINYRKGWKKKLFPYVQQLMPGRYPVTDTLNHWISRIHYFSTDQRDRLWRKDVARGFKNHNSVFSSHFQSASGLSLANKVQYMDMKTYMPDDILTKVDVASMISSLEVRTPLIDRKVWEFAASIPEDVNIREVNGDWTGKLLLKKLLGKSFTSEFTNRKKMGFAVPLDKWFAKGGQLNQMLHEQLLSENSHINNYFDPKYVEELVQANKPGHLWLLVFLEEWLRQQRTFQKSS